MTPCILYPEKAEIFLESILNITKNVQDEHQLLILDYHILYLTLTSLVVYSLKNELQQIYNKYNKTKHLLFGPETPLKPI